MPGQRLPHKASAPSLLPKNNVVGPVTLPHEIGGDDFQERHDIPNPDDAALQTHETNKQSSMSAKTSTFANMIDTSTDDELTSPPDLSKRGIHIPTRTRYANMLKLVSYRSGILMDILYCSSVSRRKVRRSRHRDLSSSVPTTPESRERSSADSVISYDTTASSIGSALPPLQAKGAADGSERLEPLIEDDPQSFSLLAPAEAESETYSLERRSVQLFSRDHLKAIFADSASLLKFTSFLSTYRPESIAILVYYLDALKALRAINYANAVAEALEPVEGHEFTVHPPRATVNSVIEDKANQAFDALVKDDLPAFISYTYVRIVSLSIHRRITGTLAPHLREASEGLAEVFCLSDPSRPDNPIVFASEGMINFTYSLF